MEIKIAIDNLTQDNVTVKKQNYTTVDEVEYVIGKLSTKAYENSTEGREQLKNEVAEPCLSAIMTMWGNTPTVIVNNENTTS